MVTAFHFLHVIFVPYTAGSCPVWLFSVHTPFECFHKFLFRLSSALPGRKNQHRKSYRYRLIGHSDHFPSSLGHTSCLVEALVTHTPHVRVLELLLNNTFASITASRLFVFHLLRCCVLPGSIEALRQQTTLHMHFRRLIYQYTNSVDVLG